MATSPATKTERHFENEGAQMARRSMRNKITRALNKGRIDQPAADWMRQALDESVAEASRRAGGLGRK